MRILARVILSGVLCFSAFIAPAEAQQYRGRTSYILAASWEPAFCATNRYKAECRNDKPSDYDATHFSLHGLWPMRQEYCDVSSEDRSADSRGDWQSLGAVQLSDQVRSNLNRVMPGTQSGLERHEWTRHGTCTRLSADDYFSTAVSLIDQLNSSAVRDLFASNIGKTLSADDIQAAFDKSFGRGAATRVKMSCRRVGSQRVISELTIGLSSDALAQRGQPNLGRLIQTAGRTDFGCNEGVVQAVR